MGAGGMARGPVAGGDLRSVHTLEQEEASVARLEVARRTQALVDQASRAAEKERPRVFTMVQPHCPTSGAPRVTVTDRRSALDTCAPEQGVWLDCDACLCFGEALDCVLATDHGLRGTLQRSLPSVGTAGESSPVGVASRGAPTCMRPY
jgi:hypothetical protein